MAELDYAAIARTTLAALKEVGFKAQLRRQARSDPKSGPFEASSAASLQDIILMENQYSAFEKDGVNVLAHDRRFLCQAIEAEPGDVLIVLGTYLTIQNVTPYAPGGVVLYTTIQARK